MKCYNGTCQGSGIYYAAGEQSVFEFDLLKAGKMGKRKDLAALTKARLRWLHDRVRASKKWRVTLGVLGMQRLAAYQPKVVHGKTPGEPAGGFGCCFGSTRGTYTILGRGCGWSVWILEPSFNVVKSSSDSQRFGISEWVSKHTKKLFKKCLMLNEKQFDLLWAPALPHVTKFCVTACWTQSTSTHVPAGREQQLQNLSTLSVLRSNQTSFNPSQKSLRTPALSALLLIKDGAAEFLILHFNQWLCISGTEFMIRGP